MIECPPGVWEVLGSIPIKDSDFFLCTLSLPFWKMRHIQLTLMNKLRKITTNLQLRKAATFGCMRVIENAWQNTKWHKNETHWEETHAWFHKNTYMVRESTLWWRVWQKIMTSLAFSSLYDAEKLIEFSSSLFSFWTCSLNLSQFQYHSFWQLHLKSKCKQVHNGLLVVTFFRYLWPNINFG